MTTQLDLFAAPPVSPPPAARIAEGEQFKREGQARAADNKAHALGLAREMAHDIAHGKLPHADNHTRADGICNADDVCAQFEREGREWIGNAAGKLFERSCWAPLGYTKSIREHAHANLIINWKWKHGE